MSDSSNPATAVCQIELRKMTYPAGDRSGIEGRIRISRRRCEFEPVDIDIPHENRSDRNIAFNHRGGYDQGTQGARVPRPARTSGHWKVPALPFVGTLGARDSPTAPRSLG
jgi:hypothetical protein